MVKQILIIFFLLTATAHAENWVCQDGDSLVRKQGDGMRLGICGLNNSNIQANCILANQREYSDATQPNKKLNKSASGNRVIDMSQPEIDARNIARAAAKAAAKAAREKDQDNAAVKDRSNITLTKVDAVIDNIGDLTDAKDFLKRIIRYIIDTNNDI